MRAELGDVLHEGLAFDVAVGAEAGGELVEVVVVVAGVDDEFPGAMVGEGGERFGEGLGGEVSGGGDGDGAVGGADLLVGAAHLVEEVGAEVVAEEFEDEAAGTGAVVEGEGPAGFEGVADGSDAGALGDVEEGTGDGGEDVGVLVGVEVGDVDAGALELLDLGGGFAQDVVLADGTA